MFFYGFSLLLLQEFHHHFLSLLFSHFDFFAVIHCLQCFGKDFQIDFRTLLLHLFQGASDIHTHSIACLLHGITD